MREAASGSVNALALGEIAVRPVRAEERARWRQLMRAHHDFGLRSIVGQSLCYVALYGEDWVALLGRGAAALKCAARAAWMRSSPALRLRRLPLLANNVRFLVLPGWRRPNLASHILALSLRRLSADWERY